MRATVVSRHPCGKAPNSVLISMPGIIGSTGWDRSRGCICGFPSRRWGNGH
jgi:hypothetical protein